jgi:hypothetical protein
MQERPGRRRYSANRIDQALDSPLVGRRQRRYSTRSWPARRSKVTPSPPRSCMPRNKAPKPTKPLVDQTSSMTRVMGWWFAIACDPPGKRVGRGGTRRDTHTYTSQTSHAISGTVCACHGLSGNSRRPWPRRAAALVAESGLTRLQVKYALDRLARCGLVLVDGGQGNRFTVYRLA